VGIVTAGFLAKAIGFEINLPAAAIPIILPTIAVLLVRGVAAMSN
jgi:hypothetical protein